MAHEFCDTSFFDEDVAKYEELRAIHQDYVDELEDLDRDSFCNPPHDPLVSLFIDDFTKMRLSEIESKRENLKRDRQYEISKAKSKIASIETRIRTLKTLKLRYEAFFEHELLPAIKDEDAFEKEDIASLANTCLKFAYGTAAYEPLFATFGLPDGLDDAFGGICERYSELRYRNCKEKLL